MATARDAAEVRWGEAQELYAHALRLGDSVAITEARAELDAARDALGESTPPSELALNALDADVARLDERLAARRARASDRDLLPARSIGIADRVSTGEQLVHDLIARQSSRGGAEGAPIIKFGRKVVAEAHAANIAALGEEFTHDLGRVDEALAATAVELRSARDRSVVPAPLATTAIAVTVGGSALGQAVTAREALTQVDDGRTPFVVPAIDSTSATVLALGYVATLAAAAYLAGSFVATRRAKENDEIRDRWALRFRDSLLAASALTALLLSPLFLASVLAGYFAADGSVGGSVLFACLGATFVSMMFMVGFRQQRPTSGHAVTGARQRYASLEARRLRVLRRFVAQAEELLADARRLESLYVHESILGADEAAEEVRGDEARVLEPSWLTFARSELSRAEPSSRTREPSLT